MKDRFLRACRREPVDATPVWFMRQAGRALPEYRAIRERAGLIEITRDAALCAEVTLQPVRRLGVDAAILFADVTTPFSGLGIEYDIVEGRGPIVARPVRSAAAIAALRGFEPEEAVAPLLEAIRLVRAESPVPLIGLAGAPFTLACHLVEGGPSKDFARTKALMHAEPAAWAGLMDRLSAATIAYLGAQVAAGVQAIQVFDSWVGALSPADYRRSVAPWMARIFAKLRPLHVPTIHFGVISAGLLRQQAAAAATSSASTGGSTSPRAGRSSGRTAESRETSIRRSCSARGRPSPATPGRSSTQPAEGPATSSTSATASFPAPTRMPWPAWSTSSTPTPPEARPPDRPPPPGPRPCRGEDRSAAVD